MVNRSKVWKESGSADEKTVVDLYTVLKYRDWPIFGMKIYGQLKTNETVANHSNEILRITKIEKVLETTNHLETSNQQFWKKF